MKNYFKSILILGLVAMLFASCTKEEDIALPQTAPAVFSEDFGTYTNSTYSFDFTDWTVYTEAGTKNWFIANYGTGALNNVYVEFSSFNSGNSSNIGWLITPAIDIDQTVLKRMSFQSAQHHATSLDNKFEVLVSDDFDGVNVQLATWKKKTFRTPTLGTSYNYDFFPSGAVSLSEFSGKIHVAFKVTGNGTTQTGGFQVDNVKFF